MATLLDEDFETGAPGVTISAANSAFNGGAVATPTFDATRAVTGAQSALFNPTASAESVQLTFGAATATFSVRFYLYVPTLPAVNTFLINLQSTATVRASLRLNTDGTISLRNFTTAVATSVGAITAAAWYRIEWQLDNGATNQSARIFSGSGTTPIGTDTSGTYNQGTMDRALFGVPTSGTLTYNADAVLMSDTAAYLGPAATGFGKPTGLTVTTISGSELDLTWNAVDTATSYDVTRGGVVITNVATTSYNDTGLSPGTTYTYRVIAVK